MMNLPQKAISVHKPVMVSEVVSNLITDPNGIYIDGTVGLGGHALEILKMLGKNGRFIGIDRDQNALKIAQDNLTHYLPRINFINDSYAHCDEILKRLSYKNTTGILLDLGLSSAQLSDKQRGFSYDGSGALDMRFDQDSGISAADFIKSHSEEEISDILWNFGEERFSRKIAHNIKYSQGMKTTKDLCEAIRKSTPPKNRNRSFARVFQALRIAVNDELQHLNNFLGKLHHLLSFGGRIVIISYHSLEDRLVKYSFKKLKEESKLDILTKKPLTASSLEVELNSRSKSAKMRVGERIA